MSKPFIPLPETTLDYAASIYGSLLMAEKQNTVSNVKNYLSIAKSRTEELIKK